MFFTPIWNWLKLQSRTSKDHRRRRQRSQCQPRLFLEALEDRTLLSASWTAIGPVPLAGAGVAGDVVSGRIAGVAADPTDANIIYIAAAGGGVWKTTNGGTSWSPLTDTQQTLSMGAIALAPSNHQVIYAGTGEANNSLDSNYGTGILVSTDGGTSWTLDNPGGIFTGLTVSKIAVDPSNSSIAYAAIGNIGENRSFINGTGIYKTINGGVSWTNMTAGPIGDTSDAFSDIVIDPTTSGSTATLYAALGPFYGNAKDGVYKSTDAGATWSELTNLPTGANDGRIALALAPSNPSVVYAAVAQSTGTGGGLALLEESTDGGNNWTNRTAAALAVGGDFTNGAGWYNLALAVNPTDPTTVYAGGSFNNGSPGIIESTNSGASWTNIVSDDLGLSPHTDIHAMTFDKNGNLLLGSDGGIFQKIANPNPPHGFLWNDLNGNLNTIQFMGIAINPTDATQALGGSQDNGTELFKSGSGWSMTDGGDGGLVRYSQQNSQIVYRDSPVNSFGVTRFFRTSTDGGKTWTAATTGLPNTFGNVANFYPPFAVDPSNGSRVVLGSNQIYLTTNGAGNWTGLTSTGSKGWNSSGHNVDAIGLAASDANTIYASVGGSFASSSQIFLSTDGGTNWVERDLPGGSGRVNDIIVDPSNAQTAYAVVSTFTGGGGHVWKTTNGGVNWTDISGNLPDLPTWTIQLDATNHVLYVGTDSGVYSSSNGGTTWSTFGTGLPNVQVFDLDYVSSLKLLGAGTHGRGMWEISTVVAPTVTDVTSSTANGTYGIGATVSIQVTFSSTVTVTGTPQIALTSGGTASYASGSGGNTLTFTYVVGAGDTTNGGKLDYSSTSALSLNGGTIKDSGGNAATLTLPADGSGHSLSDNKNIVIDGVAPTVSNITSSTANGTYGTGATVSIQIAFSKVVTVTGTPQLTLNSGGTASYSSGSGSNTLTFTYVVGAGDTTSGGKLDYSSTSALTLNGGTIKDSANNAATLTLPADGSGHSLSDNKNIIIDATTPTVTNATSSTANGTYGTGGTVSIQVTFSEAVTITGTPKLALNSGGSASYASGSGGTTLTFTYTVGAGDTTNGGKLDSSSTGALSLNGGTINNAGGNAATLTLPADGSGHSLSDNKNIIINGVAPTVSNVTSTTANGTYGTGATVSIQVTFSSAVTVTGTPQLTLNSGGTASYASGSGSNTLTFTYVVGAGDTTSGGKLDYSSTSALSLNGGTIKDSANNAATLTLPADGSGHSLSDNKNIVIDATTPTVTNVTSSTTNGTYGTGGTVSIQITFSEAVTITGTPQLALNSGGTASYASGSGGTTLTFTYVVGAGDTTNGGKLDYSSTGALSLNGGTILNAGGNAASLTLPADGSGHSLSDNNSIVIDTTAPTVTNVTSSTANGTYGTGATVSIQIAFSSAVTVTVTPQIALTSGGTANYSSGSGGNTLTFTYVVGAGDTTNGGKLDYSSTSALSLNGGTIKDSGGNTATLTLPADGSGHSLSDNKNIVIDATTPTVTNVTSSTANGTYGTGATVSIQVAFSEAVTVTGTPQLALNSGGTASYASGSGSNILTFTYTVSAGDTTNGGKLDSSSTGALSLNGGTINNAGGNAATLTLPADGSGHSLSDNKNIIINGVAPTVTNITSSTANGTYGTGATVSIQVTFSSAVTVTGTPQLALNSGGTASYASGSGSSTLTFTYVVGASDTTNGGKLDYSSTSALSLNGGTIKDSGGNAATLTLPADGSGHSLSDNKNIVIDATTPTVTNVTSSTANGTYGTGATVSIQVAFSEAVTVTGTPQLALNSGGTASYASGSGGSILTFTYTVGAGDTTNGGKLDYSSTSALSLNGGTIQNAGGNAASLTLPADGSSHSLSDNKNIIINGVAPTVTNITSSTANGTYGTGATVSIQVAFSSVVTVTGTPQLALNSGGTANYSSGSGGSTLTFTYTVGAGDTTNGGKLDYSSTSALTLNGGTIKDSGGNAATLTLPADGSGHSLSDNKNIVIDATTPTVSNVTSSTADGTYGTGATVSIQIAFSEAVTVTGTPQLALNSGGTASYASGSGSSILTFTYTVGASDTTNGGKLDYSSTSALSLNGGTIQNAGGNAATLTLPADGSGHSLSDNKNIVIITTPPTVSGISPSSGPTTGGTNVTITGSGFTGVTAVHFGGTAAAFRIVDDQHIIATSPAAIAGPVDVTLINLIGTSSISKADLFFYNPVPAITNITPNYGSPLGGTQMTLSGSGFSGATAVQFGGVNATSFHVVNGNTITAVSPAGSVGAVDVTVTTLGGVSSFVTADHFTYVAAGTPIVTSLSQHSGPINGGNQLVIFGSGFANATSVQFGTVTLKISPLLRLDNEIFVVVPPALGAKVGTVDVTVTNPTGTSVPTTADQYSYVLAGTPSVTRLETKSGPGSGGNTVTIRGTNFTNATAVHFGATAASNVTVLNNSTLTVSAPTGVGVVDVTVTNSIGVSPTGAADLYTFVAAPTVTGITPASGPLAGGNTLTIGGSGFTGATAVHFGNTVALNFTVVNDTTLTVFAPSGAAGLVDVTVTTVGGTSGKSSADQYTYLVPGPVPGTPSVVSLSTNAGSPSGGDRVNIFGSGFTNAVSVQFGAVTLKPNVQFFVLSDNEIVVIVPPSPGQNPGTVDVTVANGVGTSVKNTADQFTYFSATGLGAAKPSPKAT